MPVRVCARVLSVCRSVLAFLCRSPFCHGGGPPSSAYRLSKTFGPFRSWRREEMMGYPAGPWCFPLVFPSSFLDKSVVCVGLAPTLPSRPSVADWPTRRRWFHQPIQWSPTWRVPSEFAMLLLPLCFRAPPPPSLLSPMAELISNVDAFIPCHTVVRSAILCRLLSRVLITRANISSGGRCWPCVLWC